MPLLARSSVIVIAKNETHDINASHKTLAFRKGLLSVRQVS
jgi:hypothetical protein